MFQSSFNSPDIPIKKCPMCGDQHPPIAEFWYKDRRSKDGFYSLCKLCSQALSKSWKDRNYGTNKEKDRQRSRGWKKLNPEIVRAGNQRRRARKKGAEGFYTIYHEKALYDFQEGRCFHCECDISEGYHIDHWIPLSRGGSNWPENLRLLCEHCNCSKHDKMPWEWDSCYSNPDKSS